MSNTDQLQQALHEADDRAELGDVLVLDLADVSFMDSTGLSVLIQARRQAAERDLAWRLCSLQPLIQRLMDLTGVSTMFPLYPDLSAAVTQDLPGRQDPQHRNGDNPEPVDDPI